MKESKIEWCDHTFNPWIGCSKVHTGCLHCYAETDMDKRRGRAKWGPRGTRSKTTDSYWQQPHRWNRDAAARLAASDLSSSGSHHRPRVFCGSLCDIFEDWRGDMVDHRGWPLMHVLNGIKPCPPDPKVESRWRSTGGSSVSMDDLRRDLFRLIDSTPHLDWLLLTKRPADIARMLPAVEVQSQQQADDRNERGELYRRNVWFGCSVSDQETADRMVLELLKCRDLADKLFLSVEPLLGPLELYGDNRDLIGAIGRPGAKPVCQGIDWVIIGGESGPHARPCNVTWIRDIVSQCQAATVPVFVKQLGSHVVDDLLTEFDERKYWPQGTATSRVASVSDRLYRMKLQHSKGGDANEWPEDLRVREFPE